MHHLEFSTLSLLCSKLFLSRACVILGVIFLLSSICIVIKAIHDLAKRVLPEVVS